MRTRARVCVCAHERAYVRACVSKCARACVCVSNIYLACQFVFCCFEFLVVVVIVIFRLGCLNVDVCLYLDFVGLNFDVRVSRFISVLMLLLLLLLLLLPTAFIERYALPSSTLTALRNY